jgi:hypothetical protein
MDVFRDGEKVEPSIVADAGLDAYPGPVVADIAAEYALTRMQRENERLREVVEMAERVEHPDFGDIKEEQRRERAEFRADLGKETR